MLPLSKLPKYIIHKNVNNCLLINNNKHGIYYKSHTICYRTPILCIKYNKNDLYQYICQIFISHKIYDSFYKKRKFILSLSENFKDVIKNGYYYRYIRKGFYPGKSLFHKQQLHSIDCNVNYTAYMDLNESEYFVRLESFDYVNMNFDTYKKVRYDIKTFEPIESSYWNGYNILFLKYDDNPNCNKKTIIEIKRYIYKIGAYRTYV